jgi:ribosome-associated protein
MDEPKSKSQKKREADDLQKLGVELIDLPTEKLDQLPLTPHLKQAIIDAKKIKSFGATRRQAQLIGKLMRRADYEDIISAYNTLASEASAQTAQFHELEIWRARLINEGPEALTEFINIFHPEDIQCLRQLIKKAIDEELKGQHAASRALFRYIRACQT